MKMLRVLQSLGMFALLIGANSSVLKAADHMDAPSILIDGRMDINDAYIFQSPENPSNTIMVMTVNPLAGLLSPTTFNPSTAYDFAIDRNGDALADFIIRCRFSAYNTLTGKQNINVRYIFNNQQIEAALGQTGNVLALRGGGRLRADLFDDPFFFDLLGFRNNFTFTGMDFFEGFNVSAIVIEYPSSRLGGQNIGLFTKTAVNGVQKDRFGRPAISTALIPSDRKDEFNQTQPSNDLVNYGDDVRARIEALSGDAMYASAITAILLPDVMTFDQASTAGFLNGRKLADDVIDAELNILTNGGVTTDMVNANDKAFLATFPYLAAPN